jgi:N-acetylglucosaminyldiphosphoundecaprenol N-acetyl-beta-D-mannosaminyltransferase
MSHHAVKVLGINVSTISKERILERIRIYIDENDKLKSQRSTEFVKPLTFVTPNPEQIMYAQGDNHFADLLNGADIAIPDGIGIVFAMWLLRGNQIARADYKMLNRISGVDLMTDMVNLAERRGFTIGLIGGRGGVALEALDCLRKIQTNLHGWAEDAPEFEIRDGKLETERSILSIINEAGINTYFRELARRVSMHRTNMLFIALGAPKQEYFIEKFLQAWEVIERDIKMRISPDVPLTELRPLVIVPVGGAFDMISGHLHRAPLIVRQFGFEWFWRLIQQPWRWKRQIAIARFIIEVITEKFEHKSFTEAKI